MTTELFKCHVGAVGVHIGVGTDEHELTGDECRDLLNGLSEENNRLKQFKQNVFDLIDKNLEKDKREYEMCYESYLNGRIEVLEELRKELQELLKQFNDVPINDIYKTDTQPKKYRKKPVIIEAYQTDKELEIETLEGTMKANPGDYIVTGVQGETYPVKPDIFHETYEEVKQMTETDKADIWHNIIKEQHELRRKCIESEIHIQEAMTSYLKTVGETEDFSLRYESFGEVKLHCNGDLFDLHQIGDFCDVFNLDILITNRVVVEDHMRDVTEVKTNYLFTTLSKEDKIK